MTTTITASDPSAAEANALIAYAQAFGGTAATSTVAGAGTSSTATNYFPTDPTKAPYPSPDGLNIIIFNGAVSGEPYLRDNTGAIWTLAIVSGQGQPYINGNAVSISGSGGNMTQLTLRGGAIWGQVGTGQWQAWNSAMGDFANGTLPAVGTSTGTTASTGTTGASTGTTGATLPVPAKTPPGTSGRTLTVGPKGTYATITLALAAAQAGDLISIDPSVTYKEAPPAWTVPLRISSAVPGQHVTIDCNGLTSSLARGKGALVPAADTILDWLMPINVATDQTSGQLTSGIRPDAGLGYLILNSCAGNNNQCGVGAGAVPCVIIDNNGSYLNCGLTTDGLSHAWYTSTGTLMVLLNGTQVSSPQGHGVKSRAPQLYWFGGSGAAPNATVLDVPDGLTVSGIVDSVTFTKTATDPNHGIAGLSMESGTNGAAGLLFSLCTFNVACPTPLMETNGGVMTVVGPAITGNPITAQVSGTGAVQGYLT